MDLKDFVAERDRVLATLDEAQIRAFYARPDVGPITLPADPDQFWTGVHKSITGLLAIPRAVRLASKAWLTDRGFRSMDDGDLT